MVEIELNVINTYWWLYVQEKSTQGMCRLST